MNAIDTNVFVYAFDASEPVRGPVALALLDDLDRQETIILWQVICELGAAMEKLRRRGAASLDPSDAIRAVRARYPLVLPDAGILDLAEALRRDHGVSYWDSLLIAGCAGAGVTRLYTEDKPGAPAFGTVQIVNPFSAA